MPSTTTIEVKIGGGATGARNFGPVTVTNSATFPMRTVNIPQNGGEVVVTLPTGAFGVWVVPPSSNTAAFFLKGNTGDDGVWLHPTRPSLLWLSSSSLTFRLESENSTPILDVELIFL